MSDINAIDFNSYLARGSDGSHRLDRRVFTDPEIFELEMRVIWESNWVYLCHESQVAKPHDFMTGLYRSPAGPHHPRRQRRAPLFCKYVYSSRHAAGKSCFG